MKLLITLVAIYLIWQLFKRYVFPMLVVFTANKVKDRVMRDLNQRNATAQNNTTNKQAQKKKNSETIGEYIEFEEIEIKNES